MLPCQPYHPPLGNQTILCIDSFVLWFVSPQRCSAPEFALFACLICFALLLFKINFEIATSNMAYRLVLTEYMLMSY